MKNRLKKVERISKKEEIDLFFKSGTHFSEFPFRIIYYTQPVEENLVIPVKIAVSVPKKKFKKAVERNLLKRRIKEAYRINNHELKEALRKTTNQLHILFIYTSPKSTKYEFIEPKIILILQRLQGIYAKNIQ